MTWVSVGIAAVGAVSSIMGGISGKKAAKSAGKMQAKVILAIAAENARRRELDLVQQLGGITAAVAASNLQMSGSSKRYRNAFEANYRGEMAWDKQKARLDARTAKKGGQLVGQGAMYQGLSGAIGFVGQGISAFPAMSASTTTKRAFPAISASTTPKPRGE